MKNFFFALLLLGITLYSSSSFSAGIDGACAPANDASRIAIAGGSITEIVFFLEEQKRIVAVDRTSNFPAAAKQYPTLGYVRNLSAEGVLSLKPSLVLGEHDMGPVEVLAQLKATNVQTVRLPEWHSASGIVEKVRCVASILNVEKKAEKIILDRLQSQVDRLFKVGIVNGDKAKVVVLLTFAEGAPIVAGRDTSGDAVLRMAGAVNAFNELEGWKPISLEAMVAANPDVIIITSRGVRSAGGIDQVKSHPAVRLTRAGQNGWILPIDGMSLLGFGPRTLTTALKLSASIHEFEKAD